MSTTRKKICLAIGIASIAIASQASAQSDSEYITEGQDINITNDSEVNPFLNLSSKIENITLQNKEKENKLNLIDTEIELQRRNFQQELLPYQMEIQRLQLQKELDNIQNEINNARQQRDNSNNKVPNITLEDIRDRIDTVAADMLEKQQKQIEELKEEKKQIIERKNTFDLKLISESSSGVFAVVANKDGEDFNVALNDTINGWVIEGIDKEREKVVLRKNKELEVLSFDNNVSLIDTSNMNNTVVSSGSGGDKLPENEEEFSEYSWNPENIPSN